MANCLVALAGWLLFHAMHNDRLELAQHWRCVYGRYLINWSLKRNLKMPAD